MPGDAQCPVCDQSVGTLVDGQLMDHDHDGEPCPGAAVCPGCEQLVGKYWRRDRRAFILHEIDGERCECSKLVRLQAERAARGLCIRCPRPARSGRLCIEHAAKARNVTRAKRDKRLMKAVCIDCGGELATATLCAKCADGKLSLPGAPKRSDIPL